MARIRKAVFNFKPFSIKQLKVLTWWMPNSPVKDKDGIIADGAIRSGKTLSMSLSFVIWAMETFTQQNLGMCGKTIGSFRRNVLFWLKLMLWSRGYKVKDSRADNLVIISKGDITNYFYVFGGKDERSQDLIQGLTLAGVFFDEVALMPESFVNQATGRCSVDGSKFFFNCNPDNPKHWFHLNWILEAEKKNLLYLHFTMDDNLSLSEKIKERYRNTYSGVFFDRFIRGKWVAADGVIYAQFSHNPERWIVDEVEKDIDFITLGIDFGGNKSLTTFVATAVHRNFKKLTVLKDHHIEGRKGDIDSDRVNAEFIAFVKEVQTLYPGVYIQYGFADSEAQYLINGLIKACQKAGLSIKIGDSAKNEIVQRIYCANTLLNMDRLFIHRRCKLVIDGLETALWDKKAADQGKDVRLDDFTTDIDILDAFEYSWERFINKLVPR